MQLSHYRDHLQGSCRSHYHQLVDSPSKATISEVLSRPSTSPATPAEVRVAGHLVQKIIDHSSGTEEGVFKIPRRGQVSQLKNNGLFRVTLNLITAYHLGPIGQQPCLKFRGQQVDSEAANQEHQHGQVIGKVIGKRRR